MLGAIRAADYGGYYWVLDQAEIATDIMFKTRAKLLEIWPDLVRHAALNLSSEDVLGFLGRKLHPSLAAEVVTDTKRRPQGWRVRHRMAGNWVKVYDKASVLRVETVINNPREFKILRVVTDADGQRARRWCPMRKGVSDLWRSFQVGMGSNRRYLDALAAAPLKGEGIAALDALCRPRTRNGRRVARFSPLNPTDLALFRAVIAGEHAIVGFRNHDITHRLYTATTRRSRRSPPTMRTRLTPHRQSSEATASSPKSPALASTELPRTGNASSPPRSRSMTTTTHSTTSPPHKNSPTCLPRHANPSGIGSIAGLRAVVAGEAPRSGVGDRPA